MTLVVLSLAEMASMAPTYVGHRATAVFID
jgi:hypothetical protein